MLYENRATEIWENLQIYKSTSIKMGLDPTPIASHGSGFYSLKGGGRNKFFLQVDTGAGRYC